MWLATRYGFFSVVCAKAIRGGGIDKDKVMVRARDAAHLENLIKRFGLSCRVIPTPDTDYGFRLILEKRVWAEIAKTLAEEIDYGNFKAECANVHGSESKYVSVLHDVCSTCDNDGKRIPPAVGSCGWSDHQAGMFRASYLSKPYASLIGSGRDRRCRGVTEDVRNLESACGDGRHGAGRFLIRGETSRLRRLRERIGCADQFTWGQFNSAGRPRMEAGRRMIVTSNLAAEQSQETRRARN